MGEQAEKSGKRKVGQKTEQREAGQHSEQGEALHSRKSNPRGEMPQPPLDIQFRSMRVEDIGTICEIEKEAFPTPWSAGAFKNELINNHFAHYMVMEYGGEIAGYCGMWLIMDEAHITNIAVRKPYRGMKLGERLLTEIQKTASFLGAIRMTLEVRVSNRIAQNLYEKKGFQGVGLRKGYYSDNNEDALIMWADLPKYTGA